MAEGDKPKEAWEEAYEQNAETVRIVEKGRNPEALYDQDYLDAMRKQFFMLGAQWQAGQHQPAAPASGLPAGRERPKLWDGGGNPSAPAAVPAGSGGRTAPTDPKVKLSSPTGEVTHIRYMQIGEEGWVAPFALIEHEETQQFGVDMRFDFVTEKDSEHTVHIKRLSHDRFTGVGPDGCRIYREKLPADMPRVQYTKEIESPE